MIIVRRKGEILAHISHNDTDSGCITYCDKEIITDDLMTLTEDTFLASIREAITMCYRCLTRFGAE